MYIYILSLTGSWCSFVKKIQIIFNFLVREFASINVNNHLIRENKEEMPPRLVPGALSLLRY